MANNLAVRSRYILAIFILSIIFAVILAYPSIVSEQETTTVIDAQASTVTENQLVQKNEQTQDPALTLESQSNLSPSSQRMSQSVIQNFESALSKRTLTEFETPRPQLNEIQFETALPQDTLRVKDKLGGVFLQAPHNLADMHTGNIATALTESSNVIDALFINQRHRKEFDYSAQSPNILIDLSLAYLKKTENGLVVQIHGFAQEKRNSAATKDAHIIISSGHKGALKLPSMLAACLQQNEFSGVQVYGKDTDELGATKNVVKRALHDHQYHRFLHIEMSLPQRLNLKKSADARARFAQCLSSLVAS